MKLASLAALVFVSATVIESACPGSKLSDKAVELMVHAHNFFRSQLARGIAQSVNDTMAPAAKNMYQVKWNCDMEKKIQDWLNKCETDKDGSMGHVIDENHDGAGENFWAVNEPPMAEHQFEEASLEWWQELEHFGSEDSVDEEDNGRWRQMAHGKVTEIGCGINQCKFKLDAEDTEPGDHTAIICQYDHQHEEHKPAYEQGKACAKDADCTTYPNSKCNAKEGLCVK